MQLNYLISYWLPPNASSDRENALRTYFDLQHASKAKFGAQQLIVTNIGYEGAIPFVEPPGFMREYGLFAKYYGLGQILDAGYEFPIVMHDHDTFIREQLPHDPTAILCGSAPRDQFSEQCVVFPAISKTALVKFIDRLRRFDFDKVERAGDAAKARHEGMYSSEIAKAMMQPAPFAGLTVRSSLTVRDLVSFDIGGQSSLDSGYSEANPIAANAHAVHGHLNKGPATQLLLEWLNVG